MKRILSSLLVACLLFSLAACGKKAPAESPTETPEQTQTETEPADIPDTTEPEKEYEYVELPLEELFTEMAKNLATTKNIQISGGSKEFGYIFEETFNFETGECSLIVTEYYNNGEIKNVFKTYVTNDAKLLSYDVWESKNDIQVDVYSGFTMSVYEHLQIIEQMFFLEPYVTLEPEFETIDNVKYSVIKSDPAYLNMTDGIAITIHVDARDYKLSALKVDSEDEEISMQINVTYPENANIEVPEDISELAKSQEIKEDIWNDKPFHFFKNLVGNKSDVENIKLKIGDEIVQAGMTGAELFEHCYLVKEDDNILYQPGDYYFDQFFTEDSIIKPGETAYCMIAPTGADTFEYISMTVAMLTNNNSTDAKLKDCVVTGFVFRYGDMIFTEGGDNDGVNLSFVKSILGDNFEKCFHPDGGRESIWLKWNVDGYVIVTEMSSNLDAIDYVVIEKGDADTLLTSYLYPLYDDNVVGGGKHDMSTFIFDKYTYKLKSTTIKDIRDKYGDRLTFVEECPITETKTWSLFVLETDSGLIWLIAQYPTDDSQIIGYQIHVDGLRDIKTYEAVNGIDFTTSYEQFESALGASDKSTKKDDGLYQILWTTDSNMYQIDTTWTTHNGETNILSDIFVFDMEYYALELYANATWDVVSGYMESWLNNMDGLQIGVTNNE